MRGMALVLARLELSLRAWSAAVAKPYLARMPSARPWKYAVSCRTGALLARFTCIPSAWTEVQERRRRRGAKWKIMDRDEILGVVEELV